MALGSALVGTLTALVMLVIGGPATGGPAAGGSWPLLPRPEVVHGFDPPSSPWGGGHRGVDLLGRVGQTVHATRAGRISFAGRLAGRGVVVVDHGATRTTYEPVRASVHVGEVVVQGRPIGTLQLGGSHCFPRACLHWGWIRGRTYLDPLLLVGGGPVRLLPIDDPEPGSAARWAPSSEPVPAGAARGARVARIGGG